MEAEQILKQAAQASASDIFIVAGLPVSYKVNNQIQRQTDQRLMPEDTEVIVRELYRFAKRSPEKMLETGDDDFSFSLEGVSRYRASVYRQRGSLAAVVRVIAFSLPDPEQLGIPDIILRLGGRPKGLIVVTHRISAPSWQKHYQPAGNFYRYGKLRRGSAGRFAPGARCHSAGRNERLRNDQHRHDRRRDRPSGDFHPPYPGSGQYH